jgi:hypothetical protein
MFARRFHWITLATAALAALAAASSLVLEAQRPTGATLPAMAAGCPLLTLPGITAACQPET